MIIQSISGVRGLINSHLTNSVVEKYARAFNQILPPGTIVSGRDSRPSGDELLDAFTQELIRLGRNVIHCGIVPTPTVQFIVEKSDAVGGIIITASHNPIEWNGLKFVRGDGTFFHPDQCESLFELIKTVKPGDAADEPGIGWEDRNAIQKHVIHNASLKCIDLNLIRARKFKVVIDAVNGAGSEALPAMLETLGCDVIPLYCEPNGKFLRGTEPLPENLVTLGDAVLKHQADIGFAIDPDADRLALVSEKGTPLGEEYTLVLAAEGYLNTRPEPETFVTNLSTSMALDVLAQKHNSKVVRSAVGEINVVQKMLEINAGLGGEGNGGIILKEAHLGRDSLVGVTMVLNRLAQTDKPVSAIFNDLPQFHIVKEKILLNTVDADSCLAAAQNIFPEAKINTVDGVKIIWDDRWAHLRKSNTEPIIRIYAEAPTSQSATRIVDKIKTFIHQLT